jgi:ubiquitin carboxyl-terminal hydrolase 34
MSQQDHDLTDSVLPAGDQASNPPASPPRRDPMEDADSSLTRKRPRLDDGTSDNRTMPTDSASPSHASSTDTTEQLVEMTIRSQPPSSSQPTDGAADSPEAVSIMVSGHKSSAQAMDDSAAALPGEEDAPGDSPPVIAVDDAEDEEDAMGDYTGEYMHINYNEEDYFRKFPFANGGNYMVALRQITAHFVGSASLDGTVLPQISVWLDSFPNRPSHWKNYYLDRIVFWEEFAGLVAKVLARKYAFGESFCDDEQDVDEIFYPFFRSYVQLCSRLLRADADMLSSLAETGFGEQYLVTYKHLRHLSTLVRPEKSAALFHVLQKDYAIDVADMGQRLVTDFVRAKGIEHTFQFLEIVWEKITPSAMNWYAPFATHILGIIGWHTLSPPPVGMAIDRPQFCRNSCDYFRRCDALLQAPGKVVDVGVTKDLVSQFSTLLAYLCQWDDNIAVELVDELLDFGDPESPTRTAEDSVASDKLAEFRQASAYYPALVSNAWKFKLLRKYVVKGRMELRVMSIGTMDGALVDIWREYNSATDAGTHHPVMQYLAEFLLHERVTDYIISVDSHPQIIQRSGNIVGFLVVTHRYSERQTDAIWNTISHSQDPRVITATLTLLRGIINLMDFPELVYLSTKFYDLPIEKYNLDILRFLRDTTDRLKSKWYDWSSCDYKARPWNIAIRIIQDTSPNRNYNKLSNSLHTEASEQLRYLTSMVGPEERREIYSNCASHVENRSEKATGSVCAVQIICAQANSSDVAFFKRDLVIVRHFLEELCSFVEAENQQGDFPLYATALIYRLDFLRFLVQRAPEAIPVDLYQPIWDHTVGKHALNNDFRDMAWGRLSELLKTKPDSGFCAQLISDYVPCLDPAYFTLGLYSFVASYRFPTSRQVLITSEGEQSLLQIRGEELLWRMILDAPSGMSRILILRWAWLDHVVALVYHYQVVTR